VGVSILSGNAQMTTKAWENVKQNVNYQRKKVNSQDCSRSMVYGVICKAFFCTFSQQSL
jgi:hypothetical protein